MDAVDLNRASSLGLVAVMLVWLSPCTARGDQESCMFRNTQAVEQLKVVGAESTTALLHVVEQPDSPVYIASVDVRGLALESSPDGYSYHSDAPITIDIRNRSDRTLDYVFVNVLVGSCERIASTGNLKPPTRLTLAPGGRTTLQIPLGGTGGIILPGFKLEVLMWISQVNAGGCMYRPALAVTCPPVSNAR